MKWPWRRWFGDDACTVTDDDRRHLADVQRTLAEQAAEVTQKADQADALGRYLRRQRNVENHLVERIRAALGGDGASE